ncbi:MAG: hypothetical protein EBY21_08460 [Alphaproteobacteria bacterium]|nr:hypothetical protein [Alphaproteobacteria bacterium]
MAAPLLIPASAMPSEEKHIDQYLPLTLDNKQTSISPYLLGQARLGRHVFPRIDRGYEQRGF